MNGNKRKYAALGLGVVFLVCLALTVLGAKDSGGIAPVDARDSIVWILSQVQASDGSAAASSGTCWAIGAPGEPVQYIVTNGHVVEYGYAYPKADPSTFSGEVDVVFSQAENDFVVAQVVYYSPSDEKDIAILRLPSPTEKRNALVLRPSEDVAVGETVYALGYPGVASDMQSYTRYDPTDVTVTRGIISKRAAISGVAYEAFQMDVYINHGNSGGPLVDENGFAIGINTLGNYDATSGQMTDMNYAIIMDELIKILNTEQISYTLKGDNSWKVYAFGGAAAIALIGAILLFVSAGKAAPKAAAAGQLYAGASAAAGSMPPVQQAKAPVLIGLQGAYAGRRFTVGAGLTLGRDPASCQVVFAPGTPGVSSKHCSVWYNNGTFMLQDNGSSYGTFTANGQKLTPNMPVALRPGDSFSLADGANRFQVAEE